MANVRLAVSNHIKHALLLISVLGSFAVSASEVYFLTAPKSIHLNKNAGGITLSEFNSVIARSFSLPSNKNVKWRGLAPTSLFSRPKANVLFIIPGYGDTLPHLNMESAIRFPLKTDLPYIDTRELRELIQSQFLERSKLLINLEFDQNAVILESTKAEPFASIPSSLEKVFSPMSQQSLFTHDAKLGSLNISKSVDRQLLAQLQIFDDITRTIQRHPDVIPRSLPDFFFFTLSAFSPIIEKYGAHSHEATSARTVVEDSLNKIVQKFRKIYKDNVLCSLITIATNDKDSRSRISRGLKAAEKKSDSLAKQMGVSSDYDPDYPAIFNIILWLMIALTLATFAIAHGIWYMDPGRDSIIYRMTSQRMKKDN